MIASGEKKEEYREIKDYWTKRFIDMEMVEYEQEIHNSICRLLGVTPTQIPYKEGLEYYPKEHYDAVRFHRGQGGKQTMLIECKGISVGHGKTEWGCTTDKEVFIIKLGNRY